MSYYDGENVGMSVDFGYDDFVILFDDDGNYIGIVFWVIVYS